MIEGSLRSEGLVQIQGIEGVLRMVLGKRRGRSGAFTLIEILVVIVILAILAAIALPKFMDSNRRSKESALKANLALVRSAVLSFTSDTGYAPKQLSDLTASSAPSQGYDTSGNLQSIASTNWHGPYMAGNLPNDPVSGSALTYSTASGSVGQVASSAPAGTTDLSGVLLSTY
ncbi:MAG TPA: prepilin-type N-terminal cleavage/methylation domain-containing protein [Chthonomonadaceae bacterium]|nr:prepilin-type N-terminal cleavage/methylation domain-containing protein [Chthonomonadaceae bacterium]